MRRLKTGTRRAARSAADVMVAGFPDELRATLAPHVGEYAESLLHAMRNPTLPGPNGGVVNNPGWRTSMDLIAKIMRAVDTDGEMLRKFLAALGVGATTEAQALI